MSAHNTPDFEHWRALIVHRPHDLVDAICRQLQHIGLQADQAWPDITPKMAARQYDILLFDADMGHDAQFPWETGETPMPSIALIGSEAPGRIAWAIQAGADAHLLKPVTSGGVYSALLLANNAFQRRRSLDHDLTELRARLAKRESLAAATATIMLADQNDAESAYRKLRLMAMTERRTIEQVAEKLLARQPGKKRRL